MQKTCLLFTGLKSIFAMWKYFWKFVNDLCTLNQCSNAWYLALLTKATDSAHLYLLRKVFFICLLLSKQWQFDIRHVRSSSWLIFLELFGGYRSRVTRNFKIDQSNAWWKYVLQWNNICFKRQTECSHL